MIDGEPSPFGHLPGPVLTVCVCTRDRLRYLTDCLNGLRFQTIPARCFELLVVDSASAPAIAAEIARLLTRIPNARLVRLDEPGISLARNAGARAARTNWIAYLDDDAIPAPDWIESIFGVISRPNPPAVIGGRILPLWETPLPPWWPAQLRGVLSIIEHEHPGEYRSPELPSGVEPYAANMVVHVPALLSVGGFQGEVGRYGDMLLSDEEVQLAWRLQDMGLSARHEPRILVRHQIQAARLTPNWLLRRLYWQGASAVLTGRSLGQSGRIWRALPRRLAVAALLAPTALVPPSSPRLIAARWRLAYSAGFLRAALGWRAAEAARRGASSHIAT